MDINPEDHVATDLDENPSNLGYQTDQPRKVSKHVTVMDLTSPTDHGAIYEQASDTPGYPIEAISLNADIFEDLGRPSKITVTVRPGDHLNG